MKTEAQRRADEKYRKTPRAVEKRRARQLRAYASADAHEIRREQWRITSRAYRARKKAEREASKRAWAPGFE